MPWEPAFVFGLVFALVAGTLALSNRRRAREAGRIRERLAALYEAEGSDRTDKSINLRKQDALSALPWLNRLLLRTEFFHAIRLFLLQAGLKWTVGRFLLTAIGCGSAAACIVSLRIPSPGAAALAAFCGACASVAYVSMKRRQRFSALEKQLPQALDLIAGGLKVGHGLVSALTITAKESADPLSSELRQCIEEQRLGLDLRSAMGHLTERVPLHDLRIFTIACMVQRETGGNLAEILERTAALIRDRFRLRQQIRVHTAQGRMTGIILSILPIVLGAVLSVLNPSHMSVLVTNPVGRKMLMAAGCLLVIGGLLMRHIVRVRE